MTSEGLLRPEESAAVDINRNLHNQEVEYPENFSAALEQATGEFVIEHFDTLRDVHRATITDDNGRGFYNQKGFDLILVWDNNLRLAVDVSDTHSLERMKQKLGPKLPLVDEHDRDGRLVARNIPHATILYSEESEKAWRHAFDAWLVNGKKGKVVDWLEDQLGMKIEIVANLYRSFVQAGRQHPNHAAEFKKAMEMVAQQIAELSRDAEAKGESRRDLYELAERIKNPITKHADKIKDR